MYVNILYLILWRLLRVGLLGVCLFYNNIRKFKYLQVIIYFSDLYQINKLLPKSPLNIPLRFEHSKNPIQKQLPQPKQKSLLWRMRTPQVLVSKLSAKRPPCHLLTNHVFLVPPPTTLNFLPSFRLPQEQPPASIIGRLKYLIIYIKYNTIQRNKISGLILGKRVRVTPAQCIKQSFSLNTRSRTPRLIASRS